MPSTNASPAAPSSQPCPCGHQVADHNADGCMHPHDDGSFRFCPCKATSPEALTVGRITYRVERINGGTGSIPYALVGPRGGTFGLVRNIHSGLLRAIEPRLAGRVFTDASGRVELRSAS